MFEKLLARGFQVEFHSHAQAILQMDFPEIAEELEAVLVEFSIPIEELIAGGGGEGKGTQRLRKALTERNWPKFHFVIEKIINGVQRESQSHEVDHVREFENGTRLALEIEWNNKDPFYDRDLENYKRLHADGAISVGIIITRGTALHSNMKNMVLRFVDERNLQSFDDLLGWGYNPTNRQIKDITSKMVRDKNPLSFQEAFASKFVADKFGEATTHWRKLEDRVQRGVGNPCPLLLIGLSDQIITFE